MSTNFQHRFFGVALAICAGWTCLLSGPAQAAVVTNINIVDFDFSPSSVNVGVNDQVQWTWMGNAPHTSTSDTGLWDSGVHGNGFTFTQTFAATGSFPFHCAVHPFMTGSVTVQAPANVPPAIVTQPHSQSVTVGQNVTFTVGATGTPPLTYQWRFKGAPVPGATGSALVLNAVQTNQAGAYLVVVSNAFGFATSSEAVLTVEAPANLPPAIVTQPQSQSVTVGQGVTFNVAATGTPPLTYQWQFNGAPVPGATRSALVLNAAQTNQAGAYRVVVSNAFGFVASAPAVLTVTPAPVTLVKGTYTGLFYDTNGVSPRSSGSFTLRTTTQGKFSGSLVNGAARASLTGALDGAGHAQVTVSRRNASALTVTLQIDVASGSDRVTGTVSDETFMAQLSGERAVFDGRTNAAPQAGKYTIVVPGNPASATEPGGDSFGTVSVDGSGRIRLSGSLADGTKITQTSVVSADGEWPFYVSLYRGQGAILGWIGFNATATNDLSGDAVWIKPAVATARFYPAGFSVQKGLSGSRYTPPPMGQPVLNLPAGKVLFAGGNLAQPISNDVTLGPNNRLTNLSSNKLTLIVSASLGSFSGTVVNPATSKVVRFGGVALQKSNVARGNFLGTDQSGEVLLEAR